MWLRASKQLLQALQQAFDLLPSKQFDLSQRFPSFESEKTEKSNGCSDECIPAESMQDQKRLTKELRLEVYDK